MQRLRTAARTATGEHQAARQAYTRAITLLLDGQEDTAGASKADEVDDEECRMLLCALLSNRSATLLKLSLYPAAADDARRIIALRPSWAKGHFRC